jgi:UDP-3-O-[3-hydroxymyristoyl] glucosamine N-acyltransferase
MAHGFQWQPHVAKPQAASAVNHMGHSEELRVETTHTNKTMGSSGTTPLPLGELAAAIGAELVSPGDGSVIIHSAATLEDAGPGQVSFLSNPKYAGQLETTRAAAVVLAPSTRSPENPGNPGLALLKARDPYYAFMQAVVKLYGYRKHPHQGIHPSAHVDPTATIGPGTVIYPGAYVGPRVKVGCDCILYPNAVIYDECVLGDRVIIHSGAVIGADGFGFSTHKNADGVLTHYKIPQVGIVRIEDDVEISANCAIDRAALGETVIGNGTKIDDLVAIGHGAKIGPHGLVVAQVGIAGSAVLGHHVTLAGQVGVAGHLKIGDFVTVGAQAGIMADVPDKSTLIGSPAMPALRARRVYSIFTQLPEVLDRIKQLEQKVEELSKPRNEGADGTT